VLPVSGFREKFVALRLSTFATISVISGHPRADIQAVTNFKCPAIRLRELATALRALSTIVVSQLVSREKQSAEIKNGTRLNT
jgi:hypothetical protein